MISNIVDGYLQRGDDHEPSGKLSPSLAKGCDRKAIFRQMREEETNPTDPRVLRVFRMGNIAEDFVINALRHEGVLVADQLALQHPLWSGYIDALVASRGENPFILELKSVHSKAFWWHKRQTKGNMVLGEDQGMPYDGHIYQVLIYQRLYLQAEPQVLRPPHILYISKDDLAMEEFILEEHNDEVHCYQISPFGEGDQTRLIKVIPNRVDEQMRTLEWYVEKSYLPERPFELPNEHPWLCERKGKVSCPFYNRCWEE